MKKLLSTLIIISCAMSIAMIYSCKKNDATTSNPNSTSSGASLDANNQTFNDDANYYKSENDQVTNDVNTDISSYHPGMRLAQGADPERFQSYSPPCGATVDTTQINNHILIYHFDGITNCLGRHRSGTITVQLTNGNHWSDVGAVLTFSTTDYKVTRIYDGRSISFNGSKTVKNVNGSTWVQWLAFYLGSGTIKLQERTLGLQVTFSGGLTATWNTAYTSEWSHDTTGAKLYYYTASGDTLVGGYSNVYAWGIDRFGQNFYSHTGVGNPVICNSLCGYNEPMSGQVIHNVDSASLTINLGVNSNGTPYTGVGCPWGFNVQWVFPHSNGSANFLYW